MRIEGKARYRRMILAANVCLLSLAMPTSHGENVVVNGDFEMGNTGFHSEYRFAPLQIGPDTTYDVGTNPRISWNKFPADFGDHTSGSGLMLIVNGATRPGVVVWSQSVTLTPGVDYSLEAYVTTWTISDPRPPLLQFAVNGQSLGTISTGSEAGIWRRFHAVFNANDVHGDLSQAVLSLTDLTLDYVGNDFCVDDISLTAKVVPGMLDVTRALLHYPREEEPDQLKKDGVISARCVEPGPDNLFITGTFTLSETSDGLDPLNEAVSLTVGSYSVEVPAGMFIRSDEYGLYGCYCTQPGVRMWITLEEREPGEWTYRAAFNRIDASGTTNPMRVVFSVGDDRGDTEIRMTGRLSYGEGTVGLVEVP